MICKGSIFCKGTDIIQISGKTSTSDRLLASTDPALFRAGAPWVPTPVSGPSSKTSAITTRWKQTLRTSSFTHACTNRIVLYLRQREGRKHHIAKAEWNQESLWKNHPPGLGIVEKKKKRKRCLFISLAGSENGPSSARRFLSRHIQISVF